MPFPKLGGRLLSHAAVWLFHKMQEGRLHKLVPTREADASSLGFGKSVFASVSAHTQTILPLPLPSHSELPSSPHCP